MGDQIGQQARVERVAWYMEPYGMTTDIRPRWALSAAIGLFIFLFLLIFRPFGINNMGTNITGFAACFGVLTFAVLVVFHVGWRAWWLHRYDEREWRVYHEIGLLTTTMIFIGVGNYIIAEQPWIYGWSLEILLKNQLTTMAIGIFPLVGTVLFRQRRMARNYRDGSAVINESRPIHPAVAEIAHMETLRGSVETDILSLDVNDLLYVEAADNYVIVHYLLEGRLQKEMLRATMKGITEQLSSYSYILRSHKSYIVNLHRVERVSGNAQGYKLHLNNVEYPIPVSRSLNKKVRDELMIG